MTKSGYPRLCGGTYFILVLQALQQRKKAREHYKGDKDGLSDPEVLMGLCKVINPDYKEVNKDVLKGKANDYKSCKTSTGAYLPFGDTPEVRAFDDRVRNNYTDALKDMVAFVDRFIDTGKAVHKDAILVRALIDLITQDQSIADEEAFYICEDGRAIKKAALGSQKRICFPAFLLGVWHYISVNRKNNGVGKETYDIWCPPHGNSPRPYKAHMGEGILQDLVIYPASFSEQSSTDEEVALEAEPEFEEQQTDFGASASAPGNTQIYNNPLIIQQNGDGNTVIPNYGTININKK